MVLIVMASVRTQKKREPAFARPRIEAFACPV